MRKKIREIPVEPYLYKFITVEFEPDTNKNGVINITKRVPIYQSDNYHRHKSYFDHVDESYRLLEVLTYAWRPIHQYSFVAQMRKKFGEKLCDYVFTRDGLIPHLRSIKMFLDDYDILPEEYNWETAYKRWQRSSQYQKIRQRQNEFDIKTAR